MKMKILAIVLASVLVCGAGVGVGVGVYLNTPETVLRNSITNLGEELLARQEIAPLIAMAKEGSLGLSGSVDELGVEASGKIYFSEKAVYFDDITGKYGDASLSGDLYIGNEYAYVDLGEMTDGALGVSYKDLAKQFEDSIFAYGSGSEFELPEDTYNMIMEVLEAADSETVKEYREELQKDLKPIVERYTKVVMTSLEKNADYEKENDEVEVGGEDIKARVVTVTIDEKTVSALVEDVFEELEDDDELRDLIEKYSERYEDALTEATGAEDIDAFLDMYDEAIEEMGDELDTALDSIEATEFEIDLELVTPKMKSRLLKLTVTMEMYGEKEELFCLDVGPDGLAKSNLITLTMGDAVICYEISENTKEAYEAKLSYTSSYYDYWEEKDVTDTTVLFEIDIDKEDGDMTVSIPEADLTVKGEYKQDGSATTFTVDEFTMDGETVTGFKVSVTINEKDKMPDPVKEKDVKSVFDLSEGDIVDLVNSIEAWIEENVYGSTEEPAA